MKHNSVESGEHAVTPLQTGAQLYEPLRAALERENFGSYVMINTSSAEYVLGQTTTEVHTKFIERFGDDAPGWCTRIGASVFATT
ncbi:MAG TPA: hypothetical protein VKW08_23135 [Xanthobacteraceae bacterium]|jgi:hypothetical protein|nr:hypothetical protein [Xanthobacteraceae bacterium]